MPVTMIDGFPVIHKGPTNQDHITSGKATDQQLDIELAIHDLNFVLEQYVPSTTMHYAVEELRTAIRRYYTSPVIRTKDTQKDSE